MKARSALWDLTDTDTITDTDTDTGFLRVSVFESWYFQNTRWIDICSNRYRLSESIPIRIRYFLYVPIFIQIFGCIRICIRHNNDDSLCIRICHRFYITATFHLSTSNVCAHVATASATAAAAAATASAHLLLRSHTTV